MKYRTAILLLITLALCSLPALGSETKPAEPPPTDASAGPAALKFKAGQSLARIQLSVPASRGRELYRAACATCHGVYGDGGGADAEGFAQRPTDFTRGVYKLRSSPGEAPAPGDLERTIREGMPGTEMVPFKGLLSDAASSAVAEYLLAFSPKFRESRLRTGSRKAPAAPPKRPFPHTEATAAEGLGVYKENECEDCHGERGEGSPDEEDDWGYRVVMMDFREGVFKSGPTDGDIYRSIANGMRGTTMEAYGEEVASEDIWKMVDYIRSLAPGEGMLFRLWNYFFTDDPSGFDYRWD